ncbi:MAG: alpha-N-arabinofuranosidase [Acidobacteriia bacterium]|nr:alpha-N-arabinofuranosidase [Terriglobia bacterium]
MLTRRSFSKALAAAPFIARAQQSSSAPRARIKIDTERVIGDIDPKIYGNFIEHLGRCIDDGIFKENSPLSDSNGFRRDILDAARKLNVTLIRWPGGNFSSNYHWRDGIGPRDRRPPRLEMAWGTVESNRFGTHEFMQYAEMLGAEPYICVNLGTGTWTEAQQWVEYVNGKEDTEVTRLRRQNGRRDPWKVTYWGLGNEMDGGWQMGHRDGEEYSKFALEAAKLMKWTDPSIKLIAAGSSNFAPGADWIGWNRTVMNYLKNHADYLSLHMYVGNPTNNFPEFMASSLELQDRIKISEGVINAAVSSLTPRRKVHIAWDEYNVWYRARGEGREKGRNILEEHYNLEDALVVATFLNSSVNNAHIIKIANMAQLVNVIAPIFSNDKGIYLQTIYYPLQLFANNTRGKALQLYVDSPKYRSRQFDEVPYLDSSASLDNGSLVINVVNRHGDQAVETDFELEDKQFAGPVQVAEVNGPDIKSANDFTSSPVKAVTRSVAAESKRLRYSFPPHSYTMLKTKLA